VVGDNGQQAGMSHMRALLENSTRESDLEKFARDYADMVYAAAVRQMNGDDNGAADVTQAVMFVMLQKARTGNLPRERFMAGWLLKVTRYAVMQARRASARRAKHEAAAGSMSSLSAPLQSTDADVRSAVDSAILSLDRLDRELVIRRYLRGQSVAEVAAVVAMNENSAGRRIARAMEKLRKILSRNGIIAPTAIVSAVLSAEFAVKAPAASLSAGSAAANIANRVIRQIALGKLVMAALFIFGLLAIGAAGLVVAVERNQVRSQPAPAAAATTPQPHSLSVQVTSVVAGPSDAILKQVLVDLLENQKKFQSIHLAAITIVYSYDSFQRHAWVDPVHTIGQAWVEAAPPKRARIEIARGRLPQMHIGDKAMPVKDGSYFECWDGTTTTRRFGPPLSQNSGEVYDSRSLLGEELLGKDYSMQLAWDNETSADLQGHHVIFDRYPLDPAVLAQMKLSARRVVLGGGQNAMELIEEIPREKAPRQHTETFWFDAQRGYGLLARSKTISMNGAVVSRVTYLIDELTQAAPGVFYPSHAEMYWEMRGQPVFWEYFEATSVSANEPLSDALFKLDLPRGMKVYDYINNIGTKRDWNNWPPVP
jgi:RNA polymerase sigma factor (sigma-70 family)